MKIVDRTPYRNAGGKVDIFGQLRGTLKYGPSWYARLQAQESAIAVLDKVLGPSYILLQNSTLLNTEIDLPLVLIGPPGIFLINVIHEKGVFQARDDEWGTVSGDKFVPAGINQVQRTVKLGQVLQKYLELSGVKLDQLVEPILMAADPGMHIDSVRPAARIVMSDALERFAVSLNQARVVLDIARTAEIARVILNGPRKKAPAAPAPTEPLAPAPEAPDLQAPSPEQEEPAPSFSPDTLGFSFNPQAEEQPEKPAAAPFSSPASQEAEAAEPEETTGSGTGAPAPVAPPTRLFGMTRPQLLILGGVLLFWLCAISLFAIYIIRLA